jgi:hypothetical protein
MQRSSRQFHPEFGYICPSPQARRMLRLAILCGVCGAIAGAAGVFVGISNWHGKQTERAAAAAAAVPVVASTEDADSKIATDGTATTGAKFATGTHGTTDANLATVGRATAATKPLAPSSSAGKPCSEQPWPYLESKCLSRAAGQRDSAKKVRVLRPDEPAKSAPAVVMEQPAAKDVVKGEREAPDKSKGVQSTRRQRSARHHHVRHARSQYRDADDAYETRYLYVRPYPRRYEPPGWDW